MTAVRVPSADSSVSQEVHRMPAVAPQSSASNTSSASAPPSCISATELHELLLRAHASGNIARKRFADALRALARQGLFLELGYRDVVSYAESTFRYKKSQIYEFLRVSEALESLPAITSAFELGELSWSLVVELTRVAGADTEGEWLEFTRQHRVAESTAEIRDALKKKRARPRKNGNGLPGLPVRLRFEFSPEEYAIIERGFEKISAEMGAGLDGARPEPEKVLFYLMDRMLHSEPRGDASSAGREERVDSPYTVVFHRSSDCHRASVEGSEGCVEISSEALERLSGGARPPLCQYD